MWDCVDGHESDNMQYLYGLDYWLIKPKVHVFHSIKGYRAEVRRERKKRDIPQPWYPTTDGEGYSLVMNDPSSTPDTWGQKSIWRPSRILGGSPGHPE